MLTTPHSVIDFAKRLAQPKKAAASPAATATAATPMANVPRPPVIPGITRPAAAGTQLGKPQPTPPATAQAITASKGVRPAVKAANCATPKKAPNYIAAGPVGKKPMPQPQAKRHKVMKKAESPTPPAGAGQTSLADLLGAGAGHAGGALARQALAGPGVTLGMAGGYLGSEPGQGMEGVGRGALQGLGWDVGGAAGSAVGGAAGKALGPLAAKLISRLAGQPASDSAGAAQSWGDLGSVAGYFGGGLLGRDAVRGLQGPPTGNKQDKDPEMAVEQLAAP